VRCAVTSRLVRVGASLTAAERRRAAIMGMAVLAMHVIGFAVLLLLVVPHHYALAAGGVFGLGLGITAYTLGLRHAFDADHIAAIDNITRRLTADGGRPLTVGFFFSLGHASVVMAVGLLVGLGVRGLGGSLADPGSPLHTFGSLVGPLVSGTFLLAIGVVNAIAWARILRARRRIRSGAYDESELDRELDSRGLITRLCRRATAAVDAPWKAYPLGMLFGLGFDTATEIALLIVAGGATAAGVPLYAIACLPILFAAGMTFLDTLDGLFMTFAYDWTFGKPARKVFYNLAVTGLTVAVAVGIGAIQLASALSDRVSPGGGVWEALAGIDLNLAGYAIVGLFALTWVVALAVWRLGRIEERWSTQTSTGR
jgi:high-affinity nickel-transport protein